MLRRHACLPVVKPTTVGADVEYRPAEMSGRTPPFEQMVVTFRLSAGLPDAWVCTGRDPGRDLGARADGKLVEDVFDVAVDGTP